MDARIVQSIVDLAPQHGALAGRLSRLWGEGLYPCDVLALSILNRSLDVSSGFVLTSQRLYYSSSVCLLRIQLDSVLRFNGIITSPDPHDIANRVLNGQELRKMMDADKKPMTDRNLVEKLAASNPWALSVYKTACAHVHLSDQHVHAFIGKSPLSSDGVRELTIGAAATHLEDRVHNDLASAFYSVTAGVMKVVEKWAGLRAEAHEANPPTVRFGTSI